MSYDFEDKYKLLRMMVVRGDITAKEAKLWLHDIHNKYVEHLQDRLKRFGTNVNRDSKTLDSILGAEEE